MQVWMRGKTIWSFEANATVTEGQLVTIAAANKIGPAGANEVVVGAALENGNPNEWISVALPPAEVKVTAAANVTAGNPVKPAANGQIDVATVGTDLVIGVAMENIAASNKGKILLL